MKYKNPVRDPEGPQQPEGCSAAHYTIAVIEWVQTELLELSLSIVVVRCVVDA